MGKGIERINRMLDSIDNLFGIPDNKHVKKCLDSYMDWLDKKEYNRIIVGGIFLSFLITTTGGYVYMRDRERQERKELAREVIEKYNIEIPRYLLEKGLVLAHYEDLDGKPPIDLVVEIYAPNEKHYYVITERENNPKATLEKIMIK